MNLSAPFPNLNKACWGCSCSAAAEARLCRGPGGYASTDTLISACGTDSCEAGPGSGSAEVWMLRCKRRTDRSSTPTGPPLPPRSHLGPLRLSRNWPATCTAICSVCSVLQLWHHFWYVCREISLCFPFIDLKYWVLNKIKHRKYKTPWLLRLYTTVLPCSWNN